MTTKLYGPDFPEWFGSIGASMYTLFQVMTLESWSMGIVRPVMEASPWAWVFFVPFILVASFTVLNLFLAIIVNSLQHLQHEEAEHAVEAAREIAHAEAAALSRRSEEHTSELQSLMRISYAVFCLKKKQQQTTTNRPINIH